MPPISALVLRVLLPALLLAEAAHAAEILVNASRHDGALYVEASAEIDADLLQTWRVLTDYDHLSAFIPGMHVSRVLAREGNNVVLEQKGEAWLLFLAFPLEVRLAVTEYPHRRIVARAVAGSFREMVGTYFLDQRDSHVVLRYQGRMVLDFLVPPLIGTLVLRRDVERQFAALVDEVKRRHSRAKPPAPDR
jgi:hypothetical protein